MIDLSIIIVSYNARDMLRVCLHSIYKETVGIDFDVVVVDNASTDQTVQMVAIEFPQTKILCNNHNAGFAVANNIAIRETSSRYVLLLNPDTEIIDGAIQKTIRFMEEHPKAGIVGCTLKYKDGRFQPSAYSFPTVWNMFTDATFLYKLFPRTKLFGSYHLSHLDFDKDTQVDWLIGAYWLVRREVIDEIGLLDEQFFMYTEDTDYCYMAKKAGFEVWYTPRAEIFHYYGGFSGFNLRAAVWVQRSQLLFYQKHYRGGKIFMLVAVKCFGLVLRIIRYLMTGIIFADKRLLGKSWYAAYSLYKLLFSNWKYIHGYRGIVKAWDV